ncbi:glycosyltransferase family 4 protein [Collinsella intestinalis]|nr:glycosyltransferase family 4 protein [Collinsella intestinalis]
MNAPNGKVLLIGRLDGTRGPLGVARAVHTRLAKTHNCQIEEVSTLADVIRLVAKIPFTYKGYSICIHQNGFRIPMILCLLSKIDRRNTYYLVVHGIAAEEQKYRPVLDRDLRIEPKLIREFPNLICVSEFEKKALGRLYGREKNMTVIGNGVDVNLEIDPESLLSKKRSSYPPVVITTGGYEERKACDLALLVLSKFAEKTGTRPKLIVCGRDSDAVGSNRAFCEQIARNGNVELEYRGEITDKHELLNLYRDADFYAGLSRFDTFNVSVLEGAASCCVPIVSESCGAAALFNDSSAIRCDIDTDCWEDKAVGRLIELCDDGNLYRDVAKRSYDIASLNTWDGVAKKYWKVLAHGE